MIKLILRNYNVFRRINDDDRFKSWTLRSNVCSMTAYATCAYTNVLREIYIHDIGPSTILGIICPSRPQATEESINFGQSTKPIMNIPFRKYCKNHQHVSWFDGNDWNVIDTYWWNRRQPEVNYMHIREWVFSLIYSKTFSNFNGFVIEIYDSAVHRSAMFTYISG